MIDRKEFEDTLAEYLKHHSWKETTQILQDCLEKLKNEAQLSESEGIRGMPQSAVTHSTHWPYTQPHAAECAKLDDLFKLESMLPSTTSGFHLADVGIVLRDAPRNPLERGVLQRQTFSNNKWGTIQVTDRSGGQPLKRGKEKFDISLSPPNNVEGGLQNLEDFFEVTLTRWTDGKTEHDYLNAMSNYPAIRQNLGLPEPGLHPGNRLLSTVKHFPGIHSSYVYISSSLGSAFALHVEDFYLHSANVLYAGAPKLWIIIKPSSRLQLEACIQNTSKERPRCSQFVRHLYLLPRPSLLCRWRIEYQIVLQRPGSVVLLQPNAYHYGLNLGPNIAEAINYSDPEWNVPLLYHSCLPTCCPGGTPMLISDMEIGKLRKLEIDETWEHASIPENPKSKFIPKKDKSKAKSSFKQKNLTINTHKRKNNNSRMNLPSSSSSIEEFSESSPLTPLSDHEQSSHEKQHGEQTIRPFESIENTMDYSKSNITDHQENMDTVNSVLEQLSTSAPNIADKGSLPIPTQSNNLSKTVALTSEPLVSLSERNPSDLPLYDGLYIPLESSFPLNDEYHQRPLKSKINFWITWWKEYVEQNPKMLSEIPKTLQSLTVEKDLKFFLPPLEESNDNSSSWLNDNIVFCTSQAFLSAGRNVCIIDPLTISNAQQKEEVGFICNISDESNPITSILLPCHYENHWCLIVIEPLSKRITVYDRTQKQNPNPTVTFVLESYKKDNNAEINWKKPTPQPDDWNCAVWTLYWMEKYLFPELTIPKDPLELRARYIERLLMPCYDIICASRHIGPDISRKRNHNDDEHSNSSIKKPRITNFDIPITEETDQTHEHKLKKLGSKWVDVYDNERLLGRKVDEIYSILALVSSIGSPQVLVDLHRLFQATLNTPPDREESTLCKLYQNYLKLEGMQIYAKAQMRLICICMYTHYCNLVQDYTNRKNALKLNRKGNSEPKKHRQGHAKDAKKPSTLAYDNMIVAIAGVPRQQVQQEEKKRNDYTRNKIMYICKRGKEWVDFDKKVFTALGIHRLSDLVPVRSMSSPLGQTVKPQEFLSLIDKDLDIFIYAMKELRPRLGPLSTRANQHEWNVNGGIPPNIKLARMDSEAISAILKEELDSDLLLSSFDSIV